MTDNCNYSCRATQWPFWFGFLMPFIAVYIFDWIMFIVILTSVIRQRRNNPKKNSVQLSNKMYKQNLVIALSLSVMFGLGWGAGLLATSSPFEGVTLTLQIIFSIFVGAQGILLLILHGMRNSNVLKAWKRCFSSVCCSKKTMESLKSETPGMNSSSLRARNSHFKEQIYLEGSLLKKKDTSNSGGGPRK